MTSNTASPWPDLNAPVSAPRTAEPAPAPAVAAAAAPAEPDIVLELREACERGAVGTLRARPGQHGPVLDAFAGTGVYAGEGRLQAAILISVSRELRDIVTATTRPGAVWIRGAERHRPEPGTATVDDAALVKVLNGQIDYGVSYNVPILIALDPSVGPVDLSEMAEWRGVGVARIVDDPDITRPLWSED